MSTPEEIRARAHAKVNLHLKVGPVRSDGYHELVTVFQSLNLADELTLTVEEGEQATTRVAENAVSALSVSGLDAKRVPQDLSNLAWQAVRLVFEHAQSAGMVHLPTVRLHLHKGIPTAGGMAGGSADAAAALVAAAALMARRGHSISTAELESLAAQLGADVPFTLHGGTMLGTGRGEKLTPVLSRGSFHWALVFFSRGLSTPQVFGHLDELRAQGRGVVGENPGNMFSADISALGSAVLSGDPEQLAAALHNDLQLPATSLRPDIARTLELGAQAGALAGIVSGSGPTCAFLCSSELHAEDVLSELLSQGVYSGCIASGPGRGAHLL